ncbi:MAG: hypothetical protein AAGF57_07920 [Pseudomonadota bacterium]
MKLRTTVSEDRDQQSPLSVSAAEPLDSPDPLDLVLNFPAYATFMTAIFFASIGFSLVLFSD